MVKNIPLKIRNITGQFILLISVHYANRKLRQIFIEEKSKKNFIRSKERAQKSKVEISFDAIISQLGSSQEFDLAVVRAYPPLGP